MRYISSVVAPVLLGAWLLTGAGSQSFTPPGNREFEVSVLHIGRRSSPEFHSTATHFQRTLSPGVTVQDWELGKVPPAGVVPDLVYLDESCVREDFTPEMMEALRTFTSEGALTVVESGAARPFGEDFLGGFLQTVKGSVGVDRFPPADPYDWRDIQDVWRYYCVRTVGLSTKEIEYCLQPWRKPLDRTVVKVPYALEMITARALVATGEGLGLLTVNNFGKGKVLWAAQVVPNSRPQGSPGEFTALDLGYPDFNATNFAWAQASADFLFRQFCIEAVQRRKYGFSLRKVLGVYGRPLSCWQTHVDDPVVWDSNILETWMDLFQTVRQEPSFSLNPRLFEFVTGSEKRAKASQVIAGLKKGNKRIQLHANPQLNDTKDSLAPHLSQEKEKLSAFLGGDDPIILNCHGFLSPVKPVWLLPEMAAEQGFEAITGLSTRNPANFPEWFAYSSNGYSPYCLPFIPMMERASLRILLWSPLPLARYAVQGVGEGRNLFATRFLLPYTTYIHSEFLKLSTQPENYRSDVEDALQQVISDSLERGYVHTSETEAVGYLRDQWLARYDVRLDGETLWIQAIPDQPATPFAAGFLVRWNREHEPRSLQTSTGIYRMEPDGLGATFGFGSEPVTVTFSNQPLPTELHLTRCNRFLSKLPAGSQSLTLTPASDGPIELGVEAPGVAPEPLVQGLGEPAIIRTGTTFHIFGNTQANRTVTIAFSQHLSTEFHRSNIY